MDVKKPGYLSSLKLLSFEHKSIPSGVEALLNLGKDNKIQMDTTSNSAAFTEDNLKQYHAVVFLNTTGDVLD
ncbi:ThuA domain-containing protein [Antarcticibacterium sp. 1MA-6-2]|uniref:ThuA domain-containing protein n=1 Tax=Antarcticibacterium sp. 1MA-6-2 TaxID=2908210 RepID=UPI002107C27E|nr:ThuA domain-containing protein [Antarcticibacterium sp. 1MA-6-2]